MSTNPPKVPKIPDQKLTPKTNRSVISTSKVNTVSKRLGDVESMLKIERKNRKVIQSKFDKRIQGIELTREQLEKELEETVKILNEQEVKIYQIQKANLDKFKAEILKYENIYHEFEAKAEAISDQLKKTEDTESSLYNQTFMLKEDSMSYSNELILLREKVQDYLEKLKELESTNPKEYQFTQEDFQCENELRELTNAHRQNNIKIKQLTKQNVDNKKQRERLLKTIVVLQTEAEKNNQILDDLNNDNTLLKLEEHITKNISELILWESLKDIINEYFTDDPSQKEISSMEFVKNLEENLTKVKSELLSIKKQKLSQKNIIAESIESIKNSEQTDEAYNKLVLLQAEYEETLKMLTSLENDSKTLEALFRKYIVLIKNNEAGSSEFKDRFKTEIISLMTKGNLTSKDQVKTVENLIQNFFSECKKRSDLSNSIQEKVYHSIEGISNTNKKIDSLNEVISENENKIKKTKHEMTQIEKKINSIKDIINTRNKNLRTNLESLGQAQFQYYKEVNKELLKDTKKIYGKKILDNVFKVQKEKFLESVIFEHSIKKQQITEYLNFINKYDDNVKHYKSEISRLDKLYADFVVNFEKCLNSKNTKTKQRNILREAAKDIKEKMEIILEDQVNELQIEKQQLQLKYNVLFYIEKIKDINEKLEKLNYQKNLIVEDFDNFQRDYNEKEHKLQFDRVEIKNSINSLINNEDLGANPVTLSQLRSKPTVTKRESNTSRLVNYSGNIMSIEETIKRSLIGFKKSCSSYLINEDKEKNPATDSLAQKLRPLVCGITLYKKFDNTLVSSRRQAFDPMKAKMYSPEDCGYGKRIVRFNTKTECIEIRQVNQTNSVHSESKFSIYDLKGIFLTPEGRSIVKLKESNSASLTKQAELLSRNDFIGFTLALIESKIDFIAPNYLTYTSFETAIREIINHMDYMTDIIKELKL